ncbi:MAG: DNA helicase II, partial [Pikeienuella sp.]
GWARMQARGAARPARSPSQARAAAVDAVVAHGPGDRIFHQKFGYGSVLEVEGDKLTVAFEKAGEKRVVASFVTAADDIPF